MASSPTWLLQTWLFAIITRSRSFALFCALLGSFALFCGLTFALFCARSFALFCVFLRPTAFRTTASGNSGIFSVALSFCSCIARYHALSPKAPPKLGYPAILCWKHAASIATQAVVSRFTSRLRVRLEERLGKLMCLNSKLFLKPVGRANSTRGQPWASPSTVWRSIGKTDGPLS